MPDLACGNIEHRLKFFHKRITYWHKLREKFTELDDDKTSAVSVDTCNRHLHSIYIRSVNCWSHIISWFNTHGSLPESVYTTVDTFRKKIDCCVKNRGNFWAFRSFFILVIVATCVACWVASLPRFIDWVAVRLCACCTPRLWIMRLNYSCKSRAQKEHHEERISNTIFTFIQRFKPHIVQVLLN